MARGAAEQQTLANNQAGLDNQNAAGYQQNATTIQNSEVPVIQNQLNNPGYDPITAAAIRQQPLDATNSAFDAAKFSAAQRAGSTGNDAMYYASANDLAQKRAQGLSTDATNSEVKIGDAKLQGQQQAVQDATQLYGFNTNAATNLYGQANGALGAANGALGNRKDPVNVSWSAANGLGISG